MPDMAQLGRFGAAAAIAIVLAAAALLVFAQLNRPIAHMRIEGQLSAAERALIKEALAGYTDAHILTTPLDAVVADVAALGWPQQVSARRVWPDALVLRIHKQDVIARWNNGQYLTNNARVIDQADGAAELPQIETDSLSPEAALTALQHLDELARLHGLRVVTVKHSFAQGWWLRQSDGVAVSLGRKDEELQQRYRRFLRVRAELPVAALATLEYADVRYANGVALRLTEGLEGQQGNSELLLGQTQ